MEGEMRGCVGVERWEEIKGREDRGIAWLVGLEEDEEEDIWRRISIVKRFLVAVVQRREQGRRGRLQGRAGREVEE